jgi:antitoxin component YwqK of YwqJK toxin-antitoxin module
MDKYFQNTQLLQNTLLPYFCDEEPLKLINKQFYKLDYEKYNTHTQPHGLKTTYDSKTGLIICKKNYKNGIFHGLYEKFGKNGNLIRRCNYKNGKDNGLNEEYHSNGKLWIRCSYQNNKINSIYEVWDVNGVLKLKTNYVNGVKINDCI